MRLADTRFLMARVKFAQANGMAVLDLVWCVHGALFVSGHVLIHDIQDDGYTLHDVIRSAMGQ